MRLGLEPKNFHEIYFNDAKFSFQWQNINRLIALFSSSSSIFTINKFLFALFFVCATNFVLISVCSVFFYIWNVNWMQFRVIIKRSRLTAAVAVSPFMQKQIMNFYRSLYIPNWLKKKMCTKQTEQKSFIWMSCRAMRWDFVWFFRSNAK